MTEFDREREEKFEGSPLETQIGHLDDIIVNDLEEALEKQNERERAHHISRIVSEHSSVDLGFVVAHIPTVYRHIVFDNLPDLRSKVEFTISTDHGTRRMLFKKMEDVDIKELVDEMPPDEAVCVLEDLPEWRYNAILEILDEEKAEHIRELQQYDFNTAGRFMTNEFFAFTRETTIAEVAQIIRNQPAIDFSRRIFVLNDEKQLEGYVSARSLIINPSYTVLRQVMRPILHKVSPDAIRTEVIDLVERYKIPSLPVVDDDDSILGVINYDDVVEIMEEVADETIAQMAGTVEEVKEHEPLLKRFLARAPWLVVTLCAGLTIATGLATFKYTLWYAMISYFVPLITGMSGNVGIQSSSILVRSMATGELSMGNRRSTMLKEIYLGMISGVSFGILAFLVIWGLHFVHLSPASGDYFAVATMVSMGIFGACMTASCLGVFSPFFFVKIGVDPAVASGPIVNAFNDVFSSLMFCLIAHLASLFVL